jgi:hypothetical protein
MVVNKEVVEQESVTPFSYSKSIGFSWDVGCSDTFIVLYYDPPKKCCNSALK